LLRLPPPSPFSLSSFFLTIPPPPRSPLFPYTTLFRSGHLGAQRCLPAQRPTHACELRPASRSRWAKRSGGPRRHVLRCTQSARSDRKSTRLNSSHVKISYAVFCLKKKNKDGTAKLTQE